MSERLPSMQVDPSHQIPLVVDYGLNKPLYQATRALKQILHSLNVQLDSITAVALPQPPPATQSHSRFAFVAPTLNSPPVPLPMSPPTTSSLSAVPITPSSPIVPFEKHSSLRRYIEAIRSSLEEYRRSFGRLDKEMAIDAVMNRYRQIVEKLGYQFHEYYLVNFDDPGADESDQDDDYNITTNVPQTAITSDQGVDTGISTTDQEPNILQSNQEPIPGHHRHHFQRQQEQPSSSNNPRGNHDQESRNTALFVYSNRGRLTDPRSISPKVPTASAPVISPVTPPTISPTTHSIHQYPRTTTRTTSPTPFFTYNPQQQQQQQQQQQREYKQPQQQGSRYDLYWISGDYYHMGIDGDDDTSRQFWTRQPVVGSGRVCSNCSSMETRQWVRGKSHGQWLCHSCGQFWRKNKKMRPRNLWFRPKFKRQRKNVTADRKRSGRGRALESGDSGSGVLSAQALEERRQHEIRHLQAILEANSDRGNHSQHDVSTTTGFSNVASQGLLAGRIQQQQQNLARELDEQRQSHLQNDPVEQQGSFLPTSEGINIEQRQLYLRSESAQQQRQSYFPSEPAEQQQPQLPNESAEQQQRHLPDDLVEQQQRHLPDDLVEQQQLPIRNQSGEQRLQYLQNESAQQRRQSYLQSEPVEQQARLPNEPIEQQPPHLPNELVEQQQLHLRNQFDEQRLQHLQNEPAQQRRQLLNEPFGQRQPYLRNASLLQPQPQMPSEYVQRQSHLPNEPLEHQQQQRSRLPNESVVQQPYIGAGPNPGTIGNASPPHGRNIHLGRTTSRGIGMPTTRLLESVRNALNVPVSPTSPPRRHQRGCFPYFHTSNQVGGSSSANLASTRVDVGSGGAEYIPIPYSQSGPVAGSSFQRLNPGGSSPIADDNLRRSILPTRYSDGHETQHPFLTRYGTTDHPRNDEDDRGNP
eukprot:Plantae.Rhodophyta-Hildenbrandia_rubra.ctg2876.p1 GENE.Plantae.Rhodophyta-Hildenbrandia_rubra.ctg2876~~Plantae.Rhodophyta-Hildenbrandia_rubra.ctg2876.p1  ORF type:complete len:920 (-),score=155.48 Plantae.Rhodophyta-Hildenbrandia_rubra.ctg2876:3574-6333(-)